MNPHNSPYDPRTLSNIFFFLLFGQVVLFLVVWFQIKSQSAIFTFNPNDVFVFALPVMIALSNIIAHKIFNQQFNKLASIKDIDEKLQHITRAHLIQWALVEGGTLLLLVFALLETNQYYITLAFINILYFTMLRPKIYNTNQEFQPNA